MAEMDFWLYTRIREVAKACLLRMKIPDHECDDLAQDVCIDMYLALVNGKKIEQRLHYAARMAYRKGARHLGVESRRRRGLRGYTEELDATLRFFVRELLESSREECFKLYVEEYLVKHPTALTRQSRRLYELILQHYDDNKIRQMLLLSRSAFWTARCRLINQMVDIHAQRQKEGL